jgi:hypothetical protein
MPISLRVVVVLTVVVWIRAVRVGAAGVLMVGFGVAKERTSHQLVLISGSKVCLL